MSEQPAVETTDAAATGSRRNWRQWFLAPAVIGAMLGAIPTGIDLYKSFQYDVGYSDVKHAEEQRRLWMKNFACAQSMSYQQVKTTDGIQVQVGACPNGDVLIEVAPPRGTRILEWISLDRIRSAAAASALSLIGRAHASALHGSPNERTAMPGTRLAQATVNVVCQKLLNPSKIIRIVKQDGKCYREEIDVMKGKVANRREVPCNTTCG